MPHAVQTQTQTLPQPPRPKKSAARLRAGLSVQIPKQTGTWPRHTAPVPVPVVPDMPDRLPRPDSFSPIEKLLQPVSR